MAINLDSLDHFPHSRLQGLAQVGSRSNYNHYITTIPQLGLCHVPDEPGACANDSVQCPRRIVAQSVTVTCTRCT
jgi:hypothetical protein